MSATTFVPDVNELSINVNLIVLMLTDLSGRQELFAFLVRILDFPYFGRDTKGM